MHVNLFKSILLTALVLTLAPMTLSANDAAAWQALRDGKAVAIMRHATAPSGVDNGHLTREVCNEERNLSQGGRDQAVSIGNYFRANDVLHPKVYTSKLCRCIDTATLLDFDAPVILPPINSYYLDESADGPAQTAELKEWIKKEISEASSTNILVTHGVNIKDLLDDTGYAAQGEILIVSVEDDEVVALLRDRAD